MCTKVHMQIVNYLFGFDNTRVNIDLTSFQRFALTPRSVFSFFVYDMNLKNEKNLDFFFKVPIGLI